MSYFHSFHLPSSNLIASVEYHSPQSTSPESTQSISDTVTSSGLGLFVLLSSLVLLVCSMRQWKTAESTTDWPNETKTWPEDKFYNLPCRHCHYFNANRHLACAVNPVHVLTPEAENCHDFRDKTPSKNGSAMDL